MQEKNMKITYIFHSGFLIETEHATLLFDYYTGEIPPINPQKPLYVFVSHGHSDHFSEKIFEWIFDGKQEPRGRINPCETQPVHEPEVRYFLSNDIRPRQIPEECRPLVTFLGSHEIREEGELRIRTLRSNDLGIAFIVEIDGKCIYHAGDLNNWWWDGDKEDVKLAGEYHRELEKIQGMSFDLAFIPLDPRIRGYWLGIEDFLRYVSVKTIFPMHFGKKYEIIDAMLERSEIKTLPARIVRIDHEGQQFQIGGK